MQPVIRRGLGSLWSTVSPSLRIIGLVYTGLGGIAVLVLVVTASVAPGATVLQQVTAPARDVISTVVQPSMSDSLASKPVAVLPAPVVIAQVAPPPAAAPAPQVAQSGPEPTHAAAFAASTSLDVTIDPAPPVEEEAPAPPPVPIRRVAAAPARPRVVPTVVAEPPQDDQSIEDVETGNAGPLPFEAPAPEPVVVEPAQPPALQMATVDQPKPLPTPTPLLETPQQAKARADAANQAAIDAAKAAAAAAKAQADAANQAAIDAAKAAAKAKH